MFRRRREREIDEELQAHLRLAALDRIENGETPAHAAIAARRELGNITLTKEDAREVWVWMWLDRLRQDLRFAVRNFRRSPGTTAIMILTLAMGIGANTSVFSILDAVLLRQLPYKNPDRLVSVLDLQKGVGGRATFFDLYSDYENWKKNSKAFDGFAASTWAGGIDKTLSGSGPIRRVPALPVTADYFTVLGVSPVLGRTFEASDRDRGCTLVLSHEFWRTLEGEQSNLIGKPLRLDDRACTVIGVMPSGFAVYPNPAAMVWELMSAPARPDQFGVFVTGRMKPGVSLAAAQTEVLMLHRQLHRHDRWGALMEPRVYELQSEFTWLTGHNLRLSVIVLFSAVSIVLLICCANVANLLLGQSLVRRREMAIRAAIGSGRARLLRQLLTENMLLSASAALLGIGLATAGVYYFQTASPVELPPTSVVRVDPKILGFTVLLSIMSTVLFGLVPAWKASRMDLNADLMASGRSLSQDAGRRRFASSLIVTEVALTIVLLSGAGLLLRSVEKFASAPLGFEPDGLLTTHVQLPSRACPKAQDRVQFYDNLLRRLHALHATEAEALSSVLPTSGTGRATVLAVEGQPEPEANTALDTGTQTVSSDYFQVMRIPLRAGRLFDDRDRMDAEPVAIVNEALAARYFPKEDPVGRHVRQFDSPDNKMPWRRIVGVVAGERRTPVTGDMSWSDTPVMYLPWSQNAAPSGFLILRSLGGRTLPVTTIQHASGDPDVYVGEIEALPDTLAKVVAYPRFRAVLLAAFAGVALLLSVIGLYGVMSRMVTQRTHEIGIRMALGARPHNVLTLIAKWVMRLAAIGVVLGLALTWGLSRLITALLYGVSASDPATLGVVTVVLVASAGLATFLPAQRAIRVDPMIALRDQ